MAPVLPRAQRPRTARQRQETIIFPIVGAAKFFDDWGDQRGQGRHAGNDILTTWRSAAIAAEDGKIRLWTTSARAGCMLYLYGASGTTYIYIHLNNDLTAKHDNRGKCVPGIAYAKGLKTGSRVKAGQLIAYNGDSGDAEGIYHLHFEVHPNDGVDVNPRPYLNDARRLLFPVQVDPDQAGNARTERHRSRRRGRNRRALGHRYPRLARWRVDDDPAALDRARRARGCGPRRIPHRSAPLPDETHAELTQGNQGDGVHDSRSGDARGQRGSARGAVGRPASPRMIDARAAMALWERRDYATAVAERRNSTISLVGAPGVKIAATPPSSSSSASSAGIVPPTTMSTSSAPRARKAVDDPRHERHVRSGENRDADGVCVLLDRGLDDLLGRLMEARVDHLHAGVTQGAGDDLGAAVVSVETGLGDDDAYLPIHVGSIRR